ncbi:MAG: TonB-dependent receptor, partial [Thermoanaerobaculum sp.]
RPVSVLTSDELLLAAQASLGETLRGQPGVTTTFYSPGASRPLLRGQGGDRVRILQSGLDVGDASDTSPDHGVALTPWGLERVEVLRGPAALLYGTETLGGVVNAVGGPVPQSPAGTSLLGQTWWSLGSNGWQRAAAANLQGQRGAWSWQAAGSTQRQNDYRSAWGKVKYSFADSDDASIGLARFTNGGFIGICFDRLESSYGSPVEEEVHVALFRQRWEARGELPLSWGALSRVRFGVAQVDYHHQEYEGDEVGTRVQNQHTSARLELHHDAILGFSGILGVEGQSRDLHVKGEESYLPRTQSQKAAVFLWEHGDVGRMHWELGARWDHLRHDPGGESPRRAFDFASLTASATFTLLENLKLYTALGYTGKAPNPEELYSNGPHAATGLFEVGDFRLQLERNRHAEVGTRWTTTRHSLQLNLFRAEVANFTFQTLTGEVAGELPVAAFWQADARFWGAELSGHWDLLPDPASHLELSYGGDIVRGELQGRGGNLPRIPPARVFARLQWHADPFTVRFGLQRVFAATRLAAEETPTPGYTLVDAALGFRVAGQRVAHILWLQGANLTHAKALNHTSFFKEKSPLPGRNVSL